MTGDTTMDKERLAAFADGELSPEEAAEVAMHLADHPADQAWVDEVMAANVLLARAYADIAAEPVPDRFRDLILPQSAPAAQVLPFRRRALPGPALRGGLVGATLALAAALAAVAFLPGGTGIGLNVGPVAAASPLHGILTSLPAGETRTIDGLGQVTVLASMPTATGICREVELALPAQRQLQLGIACRQDSGWTVDVALAETYAPDTAAPDVVPAFGPEGQALDMWLDGRGAGAALSPAEEAAWIARGWTP